jgi:hypothetical protein
MSSPAPPPARPRIARRISLALLAVVVGAQLAGCQFVPAELRGGELIVMEVENNSGRPAALAVAAQGNIGEVVGSAEPAVVPAGQTMTVRFFVPASGGWAIWANGGELMGEFDLKGKRGNVPMGIDIGQDGQPGWWCKADCP